jgi:hypothetical protein
MDNHHLAEWRSLMTSTTGTARPAGQPSGQQPSGQQPVGHAPEPRGLAGPAARGQHAVAQRPVSAAGIIGRLRGLTTPGRIRALAAVAVAVSIAMGAAIAAEFGSVSSGIQLIGFQAAPEVNATTNLYFHLNDMDAQVANVLLVGSVRGLGLDRQQAQQIYGQDRTAADQALQRAAVVAGTTTAAQHALRTVLNGLGIYEALAAEAMYIDGQGAGTPGRPPAAALALYRQATDEMRMTVLPAARGLTTANAAALASAYQSKRSAALSGALWVVLLGLLLLATLIGLQVYLARRYRRLLNPALAAASVVALVLAIAGGTALAAQAGHLKVAKVDAFDSILALTQARAVSYDANADESRFLVDAGRAGFYQQAFLTKSQELVQLPGAGIFQYDAALAQAASAYRANHANVRFGGYLGAEFRNITFAGERAAAQKTLAAYQVYERDDRRIRAMNASGDLRGAIAFDTSYAPGNSNWAFGQYDNALVAVIAINQRAFAAAIHDGQRGSSGWTGVIPAVADLLIVLLVLAGVRPRLAEYS